MGLPVISTHSNTGVNVWKFITGTNEPYLVLPHCFNFYCLNVANMSDSELFSLSLFPKMILRPLRDRRNPCIFLVLETASCLKQQSLDWRCMEQEGQVDRTEEQRCLEFWAISSKDNNPHLV